MDQRVFAHGLPQTRDLLGRGGFVLRHAAVMDGGDDPVQIPLAIFLQIDMPVVIDHIRLLSTQKEQAVEHMRHHFQVVEIPFFPGRAGHRDAVVGDGESREGPAGGRQRPSPRAYCTRGWKQSYAYADPLQSSYLKSPLFAGSVVKMGAKARLLRHFQKSARGILRFLFKYFKCRDRAL